MIRYEEMMVSVLKDEEVRKNRQLYSLFAKSLSRYLENKDQQEIALLINDLSYYLILNHYSAPKVVIDFANRAQIEFHKSRGRASSLEMLVISAFGLGF